MSKEIAEQNNFKIGQKVLYPHQIGSNYGSPIFMTIVIIKDVRIHFNGELIIDVEEYEGYLDSYSIYSQEYINKLFEFNKE